MKSNTTRKMQAFVLAAAIVAIVPGSVAQQYQQPAAAPAQAQAAAPQAPASFCGNRPLCYEGMDFAATIVDFRTSTDGYNRKVLDAILRFQNKTNQVLSLAYVDGSASALDDRGNRYGLNAAYGGVRGMGVTNGNNLDTKFMLGPGSTGDVRFELLWQPPANAIVGVNYEMELDIREMNRVEGNQWTFGGETLMHYQGLANGVAGAAPASSFASGGAAPAGAAGYAPAGTSLTSSSSQPGCPPATSATAANAANTAASQNANAQANMANAQNAIANLKSMFGSKKAAATTASASAPCVPASGAAGSGYAMPAASNGPASNTNYVTPAAVNASSPQAVNAATPATANATAKAAVKPNTASSATAASTLRPAVATRPVSAPATAQVAKPSPAKPAPVVPAAKKTVDTSTTQTTSPK